ncbi:L,D-transpeptidase family protein [Halomonas sp. H5]|uniref:L,D-transpeptidase family protein n=1 Tax=Halomonas sp. H5 TaxID=3423910 RepID=UPI003D36E9AB
MRPLYRGLAPLSLALLVPGLGWADELPLGHYPLPEQGDVIGEVRTVTAEEEDTLLDIGRRHNLGFDEIQRANPGVSLWYPGEGTEIVLPTQFVLPDAPREGIVINLSELRLYYYPANDSSRVETYPISVGRDGFSTPVGVTRTTVKVKDPAWAPPRSMREEAAARGEPAPSIVPPGPDNPLGRHAILLGLPSYLIHGTNRPDGVGMRVSRGCIRMFPEDIESLYERVPNGTRVNIVDQPFKAGWDGDTLMVQAYPALEENEASFEPVLNALEVLSRAFGDEEPPIDYAQLRQAVEQPSGQPVAVLREAEETPSTPEAEPGPESIYEVVEVALH